MIDRKLSHFRILERIGEGGMGVVCRAEDQKVPPPGPPRLRPAGIQSLRVQVDEKGLTGPASLPLEFLRTDAATPQRGRPHEDVLRWHMMNRLQS